MLQLLKVQIPSGTSPKYHNLQFFAQGKPDVDRHQMNIPFEGADRVLVDSESLTTVWSGTSWEVGIPAGTPIVVVKPNGNTQIAETAQPLQVTGPVITTFLPQ